VTPLIPRATPLEAALERATAARLALPAQAVGTTNDPWACPADPLGFLAWSLSLELWDERWPEVKKRQVCADALTLHRKKTTLAGIRAHLALVDCTLERAIRPPARGFLRAAMTEEQRAAWLDSLPQLRLYPLVTRGVAVRREFGSGPAGRFFHGQGHLRANRGLDLAHTRATFADRGVEREIGYDTAADGTVRLMIGRSARRGWYGRGYAGDGFASGTAAASGIVTMRLGDDVGQFAIEAGLAPVDVRPTRVAQPRVAPRARAFSGRHRAGTFLRASWAPNLVYDRVSLHAPDRLGERRRTRSFHGRGRFGIRPFTAELRVAVPMHRPCARTGAWAGSGFRSSASLRPLSRALEAIRVSKALRDTVLVDTTTTRQVRFGDGLAFGFFAFGEIRKVA
jgi:hypothetical protein